MDPYTSRRVRDERLGETYYGFGRRERVLATGTLLPEGAPVAFNDPVILFNAVEAADRSANARVAKKIMVSLPREFTLAVQRQVVEEYVRENLSSRGYAATYAIHCDREGDNPHAHILIANRQIDGKSGRVGMKRRSQYRRDEDGNRIPVIDKATGV